MNLNDLDELKRDQLKVILSSREVRKNVAKILTTMFMKNMPNYWPKTLYQFVLVLFERLNGLKIVFSPAVQDENINHAFWVYKSNVDYQQRAVYKQKNVVEDCFGKASVVTQFNKNVYCKLAERIQIQRLDLYQIWHIRGTLFVGNYSTDEHVNFNETWYQAVWKRKQNNFILYNQY